MKYRGFTLQFALVALLLTAPLSCLAADTALPPLRDAAAEYARRTRAPAPVRCDAAESLALPVALSPDARPETRFDATTGRLHIFYHMEFNDLTEGWNWHPEEVAEGRDYYTYKYLVLGSTDELRGSYPADDMTGTHKEYPVQWRHDYFFAFDNPYAFYPRKTDAATGFVATAEVSAADAERLSGGDLRMALRGHLRADCLSDSTTFWKATPSQPRDFTLKKRYLIGTLEEILFYDEASGKVLARLAARSGE
jgi:hypothetical protein